MSSAEKLNVCVGLLERVSSNGPYSDTAGGVFGSSTVTAAAPEETLDPRDWKEFRGHRALTGHSTICWQLEVGAGETREVTCEYSYYTR